MAVRRITVELEIGEQIGRQAVITVAVKDNLGREVAGKFEASPSLPISECLAKAAKVIDDRKWAELGGIFKKKKARD